jgi:hypothetical protein
LALSNAYFLMNLKNLLLRRQPIDGKDEHRKQIEKAKRRNDELTARVRFLELQRLEPNEHSDHPSY